MSISCHPGQQEESGKPLLAKHIFSMKHKATLIASNASAASLLTAVAYPYQWNGG